MDDELTETQIDELRAALEALEVELTASLKSAAEGAKVVDLDQPIGRVSRIDAIQQQKMAEASKEKQQLRMGQVRARPESPFCLRCQGGRERG